MAKRIGYYMRISSLGQNMARQTEHVEPSWEIYKDIGVSGTVPFEDRPKGKKLLEDVAAGLLDEVKVLHLDRLGRNTENILATIRKIHASDNSTSIHIISHGIHTIVDGAENITATLLIQILSAIAEMELNIHKERTTEGIAIAKAKGVYKGRSKGSTEPITKWAQKPKVKIVKSMLENGDTFRYIRENTGVSFNFIGKVKDRLITNTRTEADILYDLYVEKDFRVVDGKALRKRRP